MRGTTRLRLLFIALRAECGSRLKAVFDLTPQEVAVHGGARGYRGKLVLPCASMRTGVFLNSITCVG